MEPDIHWRFASGAAGTPPIFQEMNEGSIYDPYESFVPTRHTREMESPPRFSGKQGTYIDTYEEGSVLLFPNQELRVSGILRTREGVFRSSQPIESGMIQFCVDKNAVGLTRTNRSGEFNFTFRPQEKLDPIVSVFDQAKWTPVITENGPPWVYN